MLHKLKTLKIYFEAVESGAKRFEIRNNNDRAFQKGDAIELHEFDPDLWCNSENVRGQYTGRSVPAVITFVTNFEQRQGFVVFGIELTSPVNPVHPENK